MAAKGLMGLAALAALTAAAAAPATVFIASKHSSNIATLTDYRNTKYQGKYANHFGKHFVTAEEINRHWWDKSFERLTEQKNKTPTTLSSSFQAVTEAFGTDTTKSLNKVCESYHIKTYKEINGDPITTVSSTTKDFWKFCTIVEAELELANLTTTGTIGSKHKNILIAAAQDKNKKFWDIQEEIFFENPPSDFSNLTNSNFYALYNSKNLGSRKSLGEMCDEVYALSENQQEAGGVDKFCSISAGVTS